MAIVAAIGSAATLLWACGGTTGHSGDSQTAMTLGDATVDGGADDDAFDTGAFDVDITYADRRLPEASAPPPVAEGGAGSGVPDCPSWALAYNPPYDAGREAGPLTFAVAQVLEPDSLGPTSPVTLVPTQFADDGGVILAPPDNACATYPWYPQFDSTCLIFYSMQDTYAYIPPCGWAVGLGKAQAGPMAGHDRYDVCMNLYTCLMTNASSWQGKTNVSDACLCSNTSPDGGPASCAESLNGPCVSQIQAAFEVADLGATNINSITHNFVDPFYLDPAANNIYGLTAPTYASALFNVLQVGIVDKCGAVDGGP